MVWTGERMNEYRVARRVLMAEVRGGRVRGRPRLGWMDGVKVFLRIRLDAGRMLGDNAKNIGRSGKLWCICRWLSFTRLYFA